MRWNPRPIVVSVLCAALAAVALPGASASGPGGRSAGDGGGVQIRRTEYGIPHILAHNYSDLGYGYGYAFAQDNACEMADRVLTLRGERSQFFGGAAMSNDALNPTANVDSDTYFQDLRRSGTIGRLLAAPAPLGPSGELRQLMAGYAAGFNRYLSDVGVADLPDPSCQGQPWVRPITTEDLWANVLDLNQPVGIGGLRHEIATATPPPAAPAVSTAAADPANTASAAAAASAAAPAGSPPASALDGPLMRMLTGERGSNGWALGAEATAGGDSMLLANPHLPFTGDGRLYQVQLTIPGVLDVSGASLYGTPAVQIGHTRTLAWTHTATSTLHMSLYRLALVPGDPTSYLVDGHPVKMTSRQVPVEVLGADGTLSTVTRTLYSSRYGPVLSAGWTGTSALTVRDANADNLRSMDQWLAMDRAGSIEQLQAAQRRFQGAPWVYTLATDTGGGTYFTDSSVTPHLTDAQTAACTVAVPGIHLPVLDGSGTRCDWGTDADAVAPGLFGPAAQPKLSRRDYVANSNNSPALTNPAQPLTGYPAVYDGPYPKLGLRPQLGLRDIAARIAGTDGLGRPGFTAPTLRTLMFDDADRSAQIGLPDVLAMCRTHPALTASDGSVVDVRAACAVLAGWDGHAGVASHGQVLWAAFFARLQSSGGPSGQSWWRIPYDPQQPLTTPRGIDCDLPSVQRALADAVQAAQAHGPALDAAPGDVRRWDGVPLHGCEGSEGCFNVMSAAPTSGQNGGVDASGTNWAEGSTFVMAVELTPSGPKGSTVLTYSQSSNPASPHYTDQTKLFSAGRWVTDRFSAADIAASPELQVTTLRR